MIKSLWSIAMKCGSLICHQKQERSFFFHCYQFPVCARCTGIIIGSIITILCLIFNIEISLLVSFILIMPMAFDWLIQFFRIKESTNIKRLVLGIIGGFGLSFFYYQIILLLHQEIICCGS